MVDSAPMQSLDVGDIRVTWIPDGVHRVRAVEQYSGSTPEFWEHHRQYIDEDDWLVMSVGGLLVQTAGRNLLIDLGYGPGYVPDMHAVAPGHHGSMIGGGLIDSLAAAGVRPGEIDAVLVTHLHPDHIGWASIRTEDGSRVPVFTNAEYCVGATEWNYFVGGAGAGTRGAPSRRLTGAMKDRLRLIEEGATRYPGVTAMPTPGHTPGHMSYVISSGQARAIVLGDAIHCPAEITELELEFAFDVDPQLNRRTKEMIARELEQAHTHAVGGHFPDAVFGRLLNGRVEREYFT